MTTSICSTSACTVAVAVPTGPARALSAVTTLEGLRGWWTAAAEGETAPGGTLRFRFDDIDEEIEMQVDGVTASTVTWTCRRHSSAAAWAGTTVRFEVQPHLEGVLLHIRHAGIRGKDVERGWLHFAESIASWAATGRGQPYGT